MKFKQENMKINELALEICCGVIRFEALVRVKGRLRGARLAEVDCLFPKTPFLAYYASHTIFLSLPHKMLSRVQPLFRGPLKKKKKIGPTLN